MIRVEGKEIEFEQFPNNETRLDTEWLNKLPIKDSVNIEFKWTKDSDLIKLYLLLRHLTYWNILRRNIYFHYMPYSRMDRDQNGNCFSLLHIAHLLNSCLTSCDTVYIIEPHSDITLNLVANSKRVNVITPLMNRILELHPDINCICYPDKGARDRFKDDSINLPIIYCDKVRDFATGEIKGLQLMGHIDLEGKNVLILDDLCSRGGTFYYTSTQLKENGVDNIYLGVCHMEYTVKYGNILMGNNSITPIKHIYCTDSMLTYLQSIILPQDGMNITVFPVEDFYAKF